MTERDQLIAWAKREFPNTVLSDVELGSMADNALRDDVHSPRLEKAHKVCPECGYKWEGNVFAVPLTPALKPKYDADGRVIALCDRCVDLWEAKQRRLSERPKRSGATPLRVLRAPDEVERRDVL